MKGIERKEKFYKVLGMLLAIIILVGVGSKYNEQVQAATNYPYLIKVNRQMCTVTIYERDAKGEYTVPIKAMLCSPGYETPLGTFKTPVKYRWKLLMDDVWGQYSTRIVDGILFHSVWYYEQDPATLSNRQFNKLGTICSHGCIRLNVEDAKWIYDNCPIGTTVIIYDSSDPGPLGKPEGIKVSEKTLMGYDPTDIWSSGNPYIKANATISGAKDKTISYGKTADVTTGVTATSSTGQNITSKMKVTITYKDKKVSKIDTTKAGKYYVTYTVKDLLGKKAQKEVVYTVIDDEKPKIYGVEKIYTNEKPDRELALKNVTVKWRGEEVDKDDIKVKWETISSKKDLKKYKVTYYYKASNGKSVEASTKVYSDKKAPVLSGVEDGVVISTKKLTRKNLLAKVSVKDNFDSLTTKDIKIKKEKIKAGNYKVTYTVSDRAGNTTSAEALYKVADGLVLIGIKDDQVIAADQVVDQAFAKEGVKAYNSGVDVTSEMTVEINSLITDNGQTEYHIVYQIADEDGNSLQKKVIFTVEAKLQEGESTQHNEPSKGGTVTENTEPVQDGEATENTNQIQKGEVIENTESVQESETTESKETVEKSNE